MSEFDVIKTKALELANQLGGDAVEVVKRAEAYYVFLSGEAYYALLSGKAKATTAAATAPATPATPATSKTAKATAAAPAKVTTAAAPAKVTTAAAPAKSGAPKAAAAAPGNTKDPKGNNTLDDVIAALQKVMRAVPGDNDRHDKGRKTAYDILAAKGGGVKGVRDLKPPLFDAVVAACEEALKPRAVAAAAPAADFGDPLGDDPAEGTGGGLDAETGGPAAPVDGEDA